MNSVLAKIGGRKFTLVVLVFLTTTIFLWFGAVSKEEFTSLTKMLLVVYPTGAIGQAFLVKDVTVNGENVTEWVDVRKFSLTVLVFIAAAALLYLQKLSGATYVELNQWLIGVYVTSNVLTKTVENGFNVTIGKQAS